MFILTAGNYGGGCSCVITKKKTKHFARAPKKQKKEKEKREKDEWTRRPECLATTQRSIQQAAAINQSVPRLGDSPIGKPGPDRSMPGGPPPPPRPTPGPPRFCCSSMPRGRPPPRVAIPPGGPRPPPPPVTLPPMPAATGPPGWLFIIGRCCPTAPAALPGPRACIEGAPPPGMKSPRPGGPLGLPRPGPCGPIPGGPPPPPPPPP